jgi:uncharacterized integral membrane protein
MSNSYGEIGGGPSGPPPEPPGKGRGTKAVVAAILLVLVVVFVIRNSQRVTLNFIVVSGHPRLIWLIVGCVLIGGAAGFFLGRPARARPRRDGKGGKRPPGGPARPGSR